MAARLHSGPHLLLGDWTPLARDPIDLIRLSFLAGAVVSVVQGEWEPALRLALTLGATLVARLLDLPRPFDFVFNVGMAVQAWGNVTGAFYDVYGYDKLVHFVLPAAMATLLYLLAIRLRLLPDLADESGLHQRAGIVLAPSRSA
jgi:hypothetical protein